MRGGVFLLFLALLVLASGCAGPRVRQMEVTGYCGCGDCCGWERGSWKFLKLNVWSRYVSSGPSRGRPYSGLTSSGTEPHEPRPGLFSMDSLVHPWMIPVRTIFPWLLLPRDGTIAADTTYYPFGTRLYIPGYGYGVVVDRGSAIKGASRLDAYFGSHHRALIWGRQKVPVRFLD